MKTSDKNQESIISFAIDLNDIMLFQQTFPLRWPNTVFARAFADVIQRAEKDYKNKHVVNTAIVLFIQKPHYLRYFSLLLNTVY